MTVRDSVFVTGGAGLLGVNWATATRDRYAVTLGLHQRRISLMGVATRMASLDSVDKLSRTLEELRPALVVHAAGMTNVEICEAAPELARYANIVLAVNVAAACARLGVPLAHISTDHLFSGDGPPVDEDEPVSPTNVYGRTKAEAESRVQDVHPGALIVRTNFYGWGPSYRPSFSDEILGALRKPERLALFHDVTYTPLVMETLINTVLDLVSKRSHGVFNVVGDDCISKHEFGIRVAQAFGLSADPIVAISIEDRPSLVTRPHRMGLSNRKASALLGRRLGGIREHLAMLTRHESSVAVKEIRSL